MVNQNKEIIPNVYASLLGLERKIKTIRTIQSNSSDKSTQVNASLEEQEKVLKHMRQTANKLQLALAKKDAIEIARLLQIYYGLNHMVQPEVVSTFRKVTLDSLKNSLSNH